MHTFCRGHQALQKVHTMGLSRNNLKLRIFELKSSRRVLPRINQKQPCEELVWWRCVVYTFCRARWPLQKVYITVSHQTNSSLSFSRPEPFMSLALSCGTRPNFTTYFIEGGVHLREDCNVHFLHNSEPSTRSPPYGFIIGHWCKDTKWHSRQSPIFRVFLSETNSCVHIDPNKYF
jgi:hypothetical protein